MWKVPACSSLDFRTPSRMSEKGRLLPAAFEAASVRYRRILVVRVRLGEGRVSTPFRLLDFALVNVGFGSTADILHLTERVSFAPACRRSDQLLQSFP